jgi:HEAT repeat protein/cyclophilin family peptidyl-prolyl cis-trans isomerase
MLSRLLFNRVCVAGVLAVSAGAPAVCFGQATARRPLAAADIDAIARLEMLEDLRQFDTLDLSRFLRATHPEVRRRAALVIGRIVDKRGIALLRARPLDADTSVAATEVFAMGQMKDSSTVAWFDSLLTNPATPQTVLAEAAIALGKIKTAGAREVLARFLMRNTAGVRTTPAIGEALLSVGRAIPRGDLAPILRWTYSANEELRWRAAWALFRPRDPAAVSALLALSMDQSALVRSWAVRGLTSPQADSAGKADSAEARLIAATRDEDRRVRTEAIRALGTYIDSAAIAALVVGLGSPDAWISVSAAEGLGRIHSGATIRQLVIATGSTRPCALRITAMLSLRMFAVDSAVKVAMSIASDTVPYCRRTATNTLAQMTSGTAGAALDSTTRAMATAFMDSVRAQPGYVAPAGRGGGGQGRPAPITRTLPEYRALVEKWIVPDYNGKPRPVAQWETPRGTIEIELFPGDAPLAVDEFVRIMEAGTIVGTAFTRVVPDFVDQEETIPGARRLRDEVNRNGLTRANLAWATGGLDTGTPGYTLNHTPQPHNEGDFTSMGTVSKGMDVVDRIQLGDRVTAAKMVSGGGLK